MADRGNDVTTAVQSVSVAVIGAGLIGERHARLIDRGGRANLAAVVDPADSARSLADTFGAPVFATVDDLLKSETSIDGVVIATPNTTHRDIGEIFINAGIPCLIEKPLAANSEDALTICECAEQAGVPVLVGHHRRYHEASFQAREMIESGTLGALVAGQVTWCLRKPDDYFQKGTWRLGAGGGPVWINLIHEIDLLRSFFGDVVEVTAMTANSVRDSPVEDTAALVLRFSSQALVSVILSDATPTPWHFEGASDENPTIAETGCDGMRLMGTKASLEFPSLRVWKHDQPDTGHWGEAIHSHDMDKKGSMAGEVALSQQLEHFCDVISLGFEPLVSARDGLENIRVTEAILRSAEKGKTIQLTAFTN